MINNWYKKEKHPWGTNPSGFVKANIELLARNTVADIGGGDGRNAIYLAKNNFEVTVIDKYQEALDILKEFAIEENVENIIHAMQADISEISLLNYDTVLCCYILHFLEKEKIYKLLDNIVESLNKKGTILITDFIKAGTFYKTQTEGYYFETEELKRYFDQKGFSVIKYEENITPTKGTDKNGEQFTQGVCNLLVQKS